MRTNTPFTGEVWGKFNNYRTDGLVGSAVVHVVLIGLILAGAAFGHHVVEQAQQRQVVTLIAPSPDTYILRAARKIVSGGGGGGDHDPLPAPKGRLPKLAMVQITPPQIVVRNQHPKLTAEPTVVAPPVQVAENHMPNLGLPTAAPMLRQRRIPTESVLAAALDPVLTAAQVLDTVPALVSEAVAASAEECTRSEVEFHRRKNFQRPILSTPRKPAERRLRAPALYG